MKRALYCITLVLCFGAFGYATSISDTPSIATLIERIKHSKSTERKKALTALKQKLKGLKKDQRRHIMSRLQNVLSTQPKKSHTKISEIFGAFGNNHTGDKQGLSGSFGQGDIGGGHDGGTGGHGGGGGGGGGHGGGGHGGR